MKKLLYFFLLLGFATTIPAQTAPTGAAETYYKNFNKSIEKLKITDFATSKGAYTSSLSQAKQNLGSIKKYAPDYDASALEKEYEKYASVAESGDKAKMLESDLNTLDTRMAKVRAGSGNMDQSFEIDLTSAEKALKTLKVRSPDYDASAYEKEIAGYNAKITASEQQENESFEYLDKFRDMVDRRISMPINFTTAQLQNALAEVQKEVDDLVNSDLAKNNKEALFEESFDGESSHLIQARSQLNETYDSYFKKPDLDQYLKVQDMENQYYLCQAHYAIAKGINTLAGKDAEVARLFKLIDDSYKKFPSMSSLAEASKKNAVEQIAKQRMQPAVDTDPALTAEFRQAFLNGNFSPSNNIQAIHIVSSTWQIERKNENTIYEKIVGRLKAAEIVVKESDGRCFLYPFLLYQPYDGSGYQKGRSYNGTYLVTPEILCEHAK